MAPSPTTPDPLPDGAAQRDAERSRDGSCAIAPAVRDGFELAHAMLGGRRSLPRPLRALAPALAAQLGAPDEPAARRAATQLTTRLGPAHTRHLDARSKALLGAEVGGATGRRWMHDAPPRPGFTAHPGVRACVRALAIAHGACTNAAEPAAQEPAAQELAAQGPAAQGPAAQGQPAGGPGPEANRER